MQWPKVAAGTKAQCLRQSAITNESGCLRAIKKKARWSMNSRLSFIVTWGGSKEQNS